MGSRTDAGQSDVPPEYVPAEIGGWHRESVSPDRITYTYERDLQTRAGHAYAIERCTLHRNATNRWEITRRLVTTRANVDRLRAVTTENYPDLRRLVAPDHLDGDTVHTESIQLPEPLRDRGVDCWRRFTRLLDTVYPTFETLTEDRSLTCFRLCHRDGHRFVWQRDCATATVARIVLTAAGTTGWLEPDDGTAPTSPIPTPHRIDPGVRYKPAHGRTHFTTRRAAFRTVEHVVTTRIAPQSA
jgi:hypothetical protein